MKLVLPFRFVVIDVLPTKTVLISFIAVPFHILLGIHVYFSISFGVIVLGYYFMWQFISLLRPFRVTAGCTASAAFRVCRESVSTCFKYSGWQLLLGLHSPYLTKALEMFSFCLQIRIASKRTRTGSD